MVINGSICIRTCVVVVVFLQYISENNNNNPDPSPLYIIRDDTEPEDKTLNQTYIILKHFKFV